MRNHDFRGLQIIPFLQRFYIYLWVLRYLIELKKLASQIDPGNDGISLHNPKSEIRNREYDPNGNRTSQSDANGNTTTFAYDANDRLIRMVQPGGRTTAYEYDANYYDARCPHPGLTRFTQPDPELAYKIRRMAERVDAKVMWLEELK